MSTREESVLHSSRLFADKYKHAESEKQLGQSFWRDFFTSVAGISDLLSAGIEFEFPVRSQSGTINFIDVFWSGIVLIEQKSAGKSLDDAEKQARDYLIALQAEQRPPTIIVSDFKRIRIVEVLAGTTHEFELKDLPENLKRLDMVIGKNALEATRQEVTADQKAVELMANLFVEFEKAGYGGHEVSVFLVRILFLNFGDDTRMWKQVQGGLFKTYVEATVPDGSGVGGRLQELFQVLDTPKEKRPTSLSSRLVDFPYVNGGLFRETLPIFAFTPEMRRALVATTQYDWSKISPAIFGAMFQTVKSKEDRRHLGEHYTSVENILKVIRPLFLDDFQERLSKSWDSVSSLRKFQKELSEYHFLDPACGSGNFLLVTYKLLREMELRLAARIKELEGDSGQVQIDGRLGLSVTLRQFHGIEINEWSSQIAIVAMYLADHQANNSFEEILGSAPNQFPLTESANIVNGNALRLNWAEICPMGSKTFIFGNPPFLGSLMMDEEQKADARDVWGNHKKVGLADLVTNWFILASRASQKHLCRSAFVATSSITQGEQVSLLWGFLQQFGIKIDFAHRPFMWSNEAKGNAAVYVVVIGFSNESIATTRTLWSYDDDPSKPLKTNPKLINSYLLDAPDVYAETRKSPISSELPPMFFGSMPRDNGHLSKISVEEAEQIRVGDPIAAKYLRRLIGAEELISGELRYCLWLEGAEPNEIRQSPTIRTRVEAVKKMRETSKAASTRKSAEIPHLFVQRAQPNSEYIAVPSVSSQSREYVPMGYFPPEVIVNNLLLTIPGASRTVFSIMMSKTFNVWNELVSGRLGNGCRISQEITYNNFPLPQLSEEQRSNLADNANQILLARENHPGSSLADLYSKLSMPKDLREAHNRNDKAVGAVFGLESSAGTKEIMERLLQLLDQMTSYPLLSRF